jgi:HlyD family secretion protein
MKWTNGTVAWLGAGVALTALVGLAVVFLGGPPGPSHLQSAAQAQPAQPSASPAANADQPVRVKVVRPTREHLKRTSTPQPAHLEPYEKTDIYARVSGYLEVIGHALDRDGKLSLGTDGKPRPLDIGDRVTKGQVLAQLSVPETRQEVVQKAALVAKADAELGQAKAAVKAAQALVAAARAKAQETSTMVAKYEADVVFHKTQHALYLQMSKNQVLQDDVVHQELNKLRAAEAYLATAKNAVDTARANVLVEDARQVQASADLESAKARVEVARADRKHMEIMLDYATIRAPFDGILTRRLLDTGAFVPSAVSGKAAPLFTVARVDRLRIVADIPEAEAGLVRLGQPASFQVSGSRGQPLIGKVVRFADALDSATRTMRTEVELATPATTLRSGMFGSVTIVLADFPDALTLPASALAAGSKPSLLCVESGRVQRREIEIGYNDGVRMLITRGLDGSEQIITEGKDSVQVGQRVEVVR